MIRKIIKIDESKCNGCGACAAACHEGAIEMINGKVVINCLEDDSENLTPRINKIKDFIGEEKIKVIAKISTAEQLMGVLLAGVSAVYTPCAKEILTSFEEKFEVKIINE